MIGEWCYFKGYFTPEQCNQIIEDGLKLPSKDAVLGVDESNLSVNKDYRRSQVRFIQKYDPTFTWLFDALWKTALQANDEWFGFHISKLDYIQLAEYDVAYEGEYKDHHDVFWMNNDPVYHRKMTAIVQLTDPNEYEGCNLELINLSQYPDAKEMRAQGTVFFFPSFLTHRATPITKGTRYSLACWFDGLKWR